MYEARSQLVEHAMRPDLCVGAVIGSCSLPVTAPAKEN